MPTIELLDKNTIDKIAAGEVVECPANVAKELTENAIDSGANAITVEIKDGGVSFIRITDNGCGIPADEVRTAFLRHATSKLRNINDLYSISSLGFRGEALSSIAAVSMVEIITRTRDSVTGVRYIIEGGIEKSFEEIGAPYGTTIIMRQLFFNTPARAKFLKSSMTEGNKVADFISQLALSRPDISFKYIANGQIKLQTYGTDSLKETAFHIYGKDIAGKLIPIDAEKELVHITGFLGSPEIARGNKSFENYYVNGRYVKSKLISKAVEEGYAGNLMQHRYPFVILSLEIDKDKVDVNVHPAKLELRFSRQEEIYEEIKNAVKEGLSSYRVMPDIRLSENENRKKQDKSYTSSNENGILDTPAHFAEDLATESYHRAAGRNYEEMRGKTEAHKRTEVRQEAEKPADKPAVRAIDMPAVKPIEKPAGKPIEKTAFKPGERHSPGLNAQLKTEPKTKAVPELVAERQLSLFDGESKADKNIKKYRIAGQVFDTYILVEMQDKLFIIDQHAAHEKVMYERFMKELSERKVSTQQIFPAVVITLSIKDYDRVYGNLKSFTALGFEIEPFGERDFRITGVPVNLFKTDVKALFTELIDSEDISGTPELLAERIASAACKAAIKGNTKLSMLEAGALIDELMSLEDPYHCPHGRPTYVSMSKNELDKKFRRIL